MAQGIGDFLEKAPPETAKEIWDKWLREYLDSRLIGVPVALSTEETKSIADWCLYLGSAFPDAVQRIVQMPLKGVFAYGIIEKLLKNSALEKYPQAACAYVNAVLKGEEFVFLHDKHVALHDKFKQTISSTPQFKEFEEPLFCEDGRKNE